MIGFNLSFLDGNKIPLAWLQLIREKTRLFVAISGISFAVVLMFMQMGFLTALFDSAVGMHSSLQGDIVLISPRSVALIAMKPFSQRRLYQVLGFQGVESVSPIYVDSGIWKNPQNPSITRNIRIYGINPDNQVFNMPGVAENLDKIKKPDVVLFDWGSRTEFGPISTLFKQEKSVITEVEERRINVGGLFELGVTFGSDGTLITSDLNFLRIFEERRTAGLIDIGLIKLKPGVDAEKVLVNLRANLPKDVKVLSKEEYKKFEVNYWSGSTPIGFTFILGTVMGFFVGTIIVYQVLYTDVNDHLPEYATLKAIGYKDSFFSGVVFQAAMILATLGFLPGVLIAWGLYELTRTATLLPMFMQLDKNLLVLVLTFVMCFISGSIAIRKLREADPADIF
ncbi:MAG: ABC transporter permease DevC [Nostoc sp.]|uniref:ABC transporter permease DevC n=1 Tax=unclassified Nostoc TaxID=2593658 RepID=UPI001D415C28|nr:ABC transporter permease DevC [Nostoc sp. JL34]MBN3886752.1 FtsX-like permease family protein [Nostoc sp. JL34]